MKLQLPSSENMKDAQKAHPTRPQAKNTPEAYPLGYVEDVFEPRTKLGTFLSVPLVGGGTRDGFLAIQRCGSEIIEVYRRTPACDQSDLPDPKRIVFD